MRMCLSACMSQLECEGQRITFRIGSLLSLCGSWVSNSGPQTSTESSASNSVYLKHVFKCVLNISIFHLLYYCRNSMTISCNFMNVFIISPGWRILWSIFCRIDSMVMIFFTLFLTIELFFSFLFNNDSFTWLIVWIGSYSH